MDARYLQAATVLPNQNKVCGRTLRAFCLRHRIALEAIESPFLDFGNKRFDPLAVVMAARILSTYDKENMVGPLTIIERFQILRMAISVKYYSRCIGMIMGCIEKSLSYPKLWKKENKKEHNKFDSIPYPLACIASLCRNGVDLESAWTMPEGEAVWMSVANALADGAKIDIISTDEEKDLEKFQERVESYKNKMKQNN